MVTFVVPVPAHAAVGATVLVERRPAVVVALLPRVPGRGRGRAARVTRAPECGQCEAPLSFDPAGDPAARWGCSECDARYGAPDLADLLTEHLADAVRAGNARRTRARRARQLRLGALSTMTRRRPRRDKPRGEHRPGAGPRRYGADRRPLRRGAGSAAGDTWPQARRACHRPTCRAVPARRRPCATTRCGAGGGARSAGMPTTARPWADLVHEHVADGVRAQQLRHGAPGAAMILHRAAAEGDGAVSRAALFEATAGPERRALGAAR